MYSLSIAVFVRCGHDGHMANRLRELRKAQGLTMEALAGRTNTTASQINKLEKGEKDFTPDNTAELIIAKQRNGPTGTVKLRFFEHLTRFEDAAVGVEDPF